MEVGLSPTERLVGASSVGPEDVVEPLSVEQAEAPSNNATRAQVKVLVVSIATVSRTTRQLAPPVRIYTEGVRDTHRPPQERGDKLRV